MQGEAEGPEERADVEEPPEGDLDQAIVEDHTCTIGGERDEKNERNSRRNRNNEAEKGRENGERE